MRNTKKPFPSETFEFFLKRIPLIMALLFLGGCTAQQEISSVCKTKISSALLSTLSEIIQDNQVIEIVITVSDSSGLRPLVPSLSFPNANVALGHLTRKEIFSLCSQHGISYIDKPRMSYPK